MTANPVIHVIDDDRAMRDSLTFLLGVHGFQASAYDSAAGFLGAIARKRPDCIVTDVRMPGMSGLELVTHLRAEGINSPVIVITGHGDVALAVEAMKAGVLDFLEKPFDDEVFLSAVRNALELASKTTSTGEVKAEAEKKLAVLSPRERDVLAGLVAGKTNKMIAIELDISARTVEVYRANLMSKTQTKNVSELMRIALAAGL